jgi:hypothetical protein
MKGGFCSLIVVLVIVIQGVAFQDVSLQVARTLEQTADLAGRWRVKFTLIGGSEKNLVFEAKPKGAGSFRLLDTGPDNNPVADPLPAAWSQLTNDRVSFSGEAELPLGTCCREIGTLIFKGRFSSNNSISGKLIFVTSVDEEESPYKFRSLVGTFIAARVTK